MKPINLDGYRGLFSSLIGYLSKEGVISKHFNGHETLYQFSDESSYEKFQRITSAFRELLRDEKNPSPSHKQDQIPIRMWNEKRVYSVWGPRYTAIFRGTKINHDHPERDTLKELADVCSRVERTGYDMQIDLMYADVYGPISGLDPTHVDEYYQSLNEALTYHPEIKARMFKWSEFIENNREEYENTKASVKASNNIRNGTMVKCTEIAKNLSPGISDAAAEERAKDYLVERVTEAILINKRGQFKLSLSSKQMDFMETDLPRIYSINNAFPWRR
jgi:hypothetical protein